MDSGWASISNEVCLTLPPVVWIPNALVHNGFNNTWKPSVVFADVTEYRVDVVFSRWGDLIWTTDETRRSVWDGTKDGVLLPSRSSTHTPSASRMAPVGWWPLMAMCRWCADREKTGAQRGRNPASCGLLSAQYPDRTRFAPMPADAPHLNPKFIGEGLTYDDVLLVPAYSEVLPRDTDLRSRRFPATSSSMCRSSRLPWTR